MHYTISLQAASASKVLAQSLVGQFTVAAPATSFFAPGSDPAVGQELMTVVTGNMDGDGDLDMLATATATTSGAMSVHLNNGQGLFGIYQTVPVGAKGLFPLGRSVYRSADYYNERGAEAASGLYYYLLLRPATATHKG